MKTIMAFVLFFLVSQSVLSYPAIIVITGSMTSPSGRLLAGYSPTLKVLSSNNALVYDSGTQYATTMLNPFACMGFAAGSPKATGKGNLQSGVVELVTGQAYLVRLSFKALCTKWSWESSERTLDDGGCWGTCTADGYKNFMKYSSPSCQQFKYGCGYTSTCDIDMRNSACTGERQSLGNPVSATANSPDTAIFGDDTPITFVAP